MYYVPLRTPLSQPSPGMVTRSEWMVRDGGQDVSRGSLQVVTAAVVTPALSSSAPNLSPQQGSEKWIAQIAALLDKMPSVGQISF